jgi:hypothetical protein
VHIGALSLEALDLGLDPRGVVDDVLVKDLVEFVFEHLVDRICLHLLLGICVKLLV